MLHEKTVLLVLSLVLPPALYLALELVHVTMLLNPPGRSEGPGREDEGSLNTSSPEKTLNFNKPLLC